MSRSKKVVLVFVLAVFATGFAFAQRPDFDKIKAEKVAFFSKELELTPAEAEKFWPVYNEMEKKRFEIWGKRHELDGKMEDGMSNLSEAECKELTRRMAAVSVDEGKLTADYNEKFLAILPAKKVLKLYRAEMQFRNQLLRNYRDKEKKGEN
jgi:hypothetical protein